MAVSAVAGLVSAVASAAAASGGFFAALFSVAGAKAFAIGAGLSMVSRALAPKPNIGAQMRGITQTTREPASSRKIIYGKMRVGGQVVFLSHSGDDNKYLNLAIVFATHEIQAFNQIWFNDKKIWTASGGFVGDWGTYVTIDRKFGTSGQTASTLLTDANALWTTDHKLSGIAYIAFRLEWNPDKFPQGVPNITAVVRGKKVYDPRDQSIAYSQNPALCLRDYMLEQSYGLGEVAANINNQSVIDAANLCDEQVTLNAGGDQDRYQCNGVIDTANQIKANIEQLLSSMGGRLTYSGGEYFIDGAEYKTPTLTFSESDIISDIQTQTKQSRRGIYNGVKGIFVSEEKDYKVLDYPPQISSTYETEDGDPIYLDMPLPCVTNNTQAQRLAKIALLKSRQQVVMTMTTNLKGLRVKVGDTIQVTNDRLNYSSKVFEVIDYSLAITDGALGVNLSCIETAAALYDWTTSDEEDFLSGGELDLYDGRTVDNVTNLTLTEIGLRGPDGGVNSAVELTWTPVTDAFVELYKIRYNKTSTTNYFYASTREPRSFISGLDVTSNYDFRVQAENLIGVSSSGTTLSNQVLNGDTSAPSAPTSGSATGGVQTITAEWTNPSDIDFKHTEVFVNTSDSIPPSPTAVVDGEEYIVSGLSGAETRYFWLKAVDFSGNKSAATDSFNATSVEVTATDVDTGSLDTALGSEFPTNGLAHYWPCNSVQGDILVDVVGNVNASILTTATISTDSPSGKSFTNGSGNGWTLLNDTQADAIQTSNGFAWSVWFKSETITGGGAARIITRDASDNWAIKLKQNEGPTQTVSFLGQPDEQDVTLKVAQGEWHHACIVEDGSGDIFGYLNGEKVTSALDYTPTTEARPVVLGCNTEAAATGLNDFVGKFTEVRAYNRALTDTEVRALYRVPSASIPQELDGELIVDGTIVADKIQASSITVDKLSGDVSEVYSFGIYLATTLTLSSSAQTFSELVTPAPDSSINKYATLHGQLSLNTQQPAAAFTLKVTFERKSKGQSTGDSLGNVVATGSFALGARYVEISGNLLTKLDMFGAIANSASTSQTNAYNVSAIEYLASTDRTKIVYSSTFAFSVGDTIYYNRDKWIASGSWLTYSGQDPEYGVIERTGLTTHTIFQPLAKSNEEETYRIRASVIGLSGTGSSASIRQMAGQIQLLT